MLAQNDSLFLWSEVQRDLVCFLLCVCLTCDWSRCLSVCQWGVFSFLNVFWSLFCHVATIMWHKLYVVKVTVMFTWRLFTFDEIIYPKGCIFPEQSPTFIFLSLQFEHFCFLISYSSGPAVAMTTEPQMKTIFPPVFCDAELWCRYGTLVQRIWSHRVCCICQSNTTKTPLRSWRRSTPSTLAWRLHGETQTLEFDKHIWLTM